MEEGAQKPEIQNKKVGRRLLGKNFSSFRIQPAASAKQTRRADGRGIDDAAARHGYHERSDKETQIKRKNGCQEPIVGR